MTTILAIDYPGIFADLLAMSERADDEYERLYQQRQVDQWIRRGDNDIARIYQRKLDALELFRGECLDAIGAMRGDGNE